MRNLHELDAYRVKYPLWPQTENEGAFRVIIGGKPVTALVSVDKNGEHVIIDLSKLEIYPPEEEVQSIVKMFFLPSEKGIQCLYSRVDKPTWGLHIFKRVPQEKTGTGYQIKLYYGYEDGESGVYHAFEAVDPESDSDDDAMEAVLLDALDLEPDCTYFNYDSMYIAIPDSVVARIKADAVREYLAQGRAGEAGRTV